MPVLLLAVLGIITLVIVISAAFKIFFHNQERRDEELEELRKFKDRAIREKKNNVQKSV